MDTLVRIGLLTILLISARIKDRIQVIIEITKERTNVASMISLSFPLANSVVWGHPEHFDVQRAKDLCDNFSHNLSAVATQIPAFDIQQLCIVIWMITALSRLGG